VEPTVVLVLEELVGLSEQEAMELVELRMDILVLVLLVVKEETMEKNLKERMVMEKLEFSIQLISLTEEQEPTVVT
jgi:hypothetical protein